MKLLKRMVRWWVKDDAGEETNEESQAIMRVLAPHAAISVTTANVCAILAMEGLATMARTHIRRQSTLQRPPSCSGQVLALAILVQAIKDARQSNHRLRQNAWAWLHSVACVELCMALELDHAAILERLCYTE